MLCCAALRCMLGGALLGLPRVAPGAHPLSPRLPPPCPRCCRPNGVYDINPGGPPVSLEIVKGDVVSEARQAFNDWTTLVTR